DSKCIKYCGCRDDTREIKEKIRKDIISRMSNVIDDGRTIYVGIVFHIRFKGYVQASIEQDVIYTINMLNNDYNKKNSNFNIGQSVYTNQTFKNLYLNYVARSGSTN